MKKWILIICIAFFMSLTACDNTNDLDNENEIEQNEETTTITITFDTLGGTSLSPVTIEEGSTLAPPGEPSKSGYTFNGWSTSRYALEPFDFDTSLESHMTLYAHWERVEISPTTYTLSFDSNGGSTVPSQTLEAGDNLSEPSPPSKNGYTFEGWYEDSALTTPFAFGTMPSTSKTLYAKWEAAQMNPTLYTLSFNSNGGSAVSSITQEASTSLDAPAPPTKNGFTFMGWFEDSALTTPFTFDTMPSTSKTLYAKWEATQVNPTLYTLSFDSNGGSSVSSITQEAGTSLDAPASPTKNGFTFMGWFEDSALTTPFTFDTMPSTSKTLYAKWEATQVAPTLYTLAFNSNGGSIHSPLSLEEGAVIPDLPTPSKTNFTFEGWFMDTQLTTPFTSSTMPANNVTLYAKWESEPTVDDLLVGILESDDYDFECISGICTLNLASNVYYQYSVASKTFSFTSLEDTVENGYYRLKNETLIINSYWNVDYTYTLEEDYGILYTVDFEYSGNVKSGAYSVVDYDSNYKTEASLVSGADNRILQLKGLIDAIFDNIEDTEFEDLN